MVLFSSGKENKNTSLLLTFFSKNKDIPRIFFCNYEFDFYVRILYLCPLQAYSAAPIENHTIIAFMHYAIRSPEVGSPDLIWWLRDPSSFHVQVFCHVDLCVHVYCLVVKGTIRSLVLSSTFREGKEERQRGYLC